MEALLERQQHIINTVERIITNFKKDSPTRKTSEYLQTRLETLNNLWEEFQSNNTLLQLEEDNSDKYFTTKRFQHLEQLYKNGVQLIQQTTPAAKPTNDNNSEKIEVTDDPTPGTSGTNKGTPSRTDELLSQQRTNFRALTRVVKNIDFCSLSERWEIEDKLQMLQSRWGAIDQLHWQIDNLLEGADKKYEKVFCEHEEIYEKSKSCLHRKLNNIKHQQESTPQLELPVFTGNYANWPAFADLYREAIHNNPSLNKCQKMQHLKGKLKGEAERLVQHLNISTDNYDACWEILNHRYNNKQLLFTKLMQAFMNQPTMQKHTAYEIKRLHDVSLETVHAIHNLGVDTSTWDPILVHIITEKMDSETYAAYMDARTNKRDLPSFDELISILESKFTALEPLNKKNRQNKPSNTPVKENEHTNKENIRDLRFKFARTYKSYAERICPLCKKNNHVLISCQRFLNMSPDAKINTIKTLTLCKNCLFYHKENCISKNKCKICNNAHHTILHDVLADANRTQQNAMTAPNTLPRKSNHVSGYYDEVLLSTVELEVQARDGSYITMRCLLDQGSQINLITESAAQRLQLQRCKQSSSVFGVGTNATQSNGAVQLVCVSRYGDYKFITNALVMPKVIGNLPNFTFEKPSWPHIQNINLADPDYNISKPIDVLLDAKIFAEILMDGILRGPSNTPIAQQTKLGWVLVGTMKNFNCYAVINNISEISQYWEMEEITSTNANMTSAEEYCETLYQQTTTRQPDGRYEVRLPMKHNYEHHLSPSKLQAITQFRQLEKRFSKNEQLAENYKSFIDEYIRLGHMKLCISKSEPSCYLPHHGVIRLESQTTKLRTVFNASLKLKSGVSLNDLMECGPNLQQDLQSIILLWRTFRYVYTADIEKFYRQIYVKEEDQHLQKIVWRDAPAKDIQDYQLCTVTYGTKAAPYLAMRTIKQLTQDDGHMYPSAVNIINKQLYVDDLLGGNNNLEDAIQEQKQIYNLLLGGGFKLRKWASNDAKLLQHFSEDLISQNMYDFKHAETNKTLGLSWNPRTDQFTFACEKFAGDKSGSITKRTLLSNLSKIFDPLGWLSPVSIKGKIIFQKVWKNNLSWDENIPQEIYQEWDILRQDLHNINKIKTPRWIGDIVKPIELHGFCDASELAYGCVIYCKSLDKNGQTVIQLIAGKTKLAPLHKHTSLPRLELCSALLLSRLMKKVIESTNIQTRPTTLYGWTDSMVVLGWLQGDAGRWKAFVANRVAEILSIMPSTSWRHVKSGENAADCASRGLLPSQLLTHSLWWEGPRWLKEPIIEQTIRIDKHHLEEEKKKKVFVTNIINETTFMEELLERYSSMERITRILAWVSRFIHNLRHRSNKQLTLDLKLNEIRRAHNIIIKAVQAKYYIRDMEQLKHMDRVHRKSQLLCLNPWIDDEGILRVGGRLGLSNLSHQHKYPIIIPNNDRLSTLIIAWAHGITLHGGARLTLTYIRTRYWMIGGMSAVKRQLLKCIKCLRFRAYSRSQLMADLPQARVTPSRPFTNTGVDFAGPVDVKSNKGRGISTSKGYIAIFICLATKALHLELVSDLSSVTFLAAFKRLCARRGTPRHMYSDCGTNFVGAARSLQHEHKKAVQQYFNTEVLNNLTYHGVEWHFNAPSWPTAGGLWEAAVRRMKHHLRRVLGEQKLTYEEFSTLLTQIEACLNSRPLVALTDSTEDLEYLTPGHFLIGDQTLAPPMSQEVEDISLGTRWKLVEKMHKDFWNKWSMEYLHTLQTRSKWHYNVKDIQIGNCVIIKEDHIPPARWLLGRVTQTHPGNDGHVRVVTLKTKNNDSIKRPINKLILLPIERDFPLPQQERNQESEAKAVKNDKRQKPSGSITRNVMLTLLSVLFLLTPARGQITHNNTLTADGSIKLLPLNQPLYFDKVANMQTIQDEWKIIIYYNLTTYWLATKHIQYHIDLLNDLCKDEPAFKSMTSQLQHEVDELQHYNTLLKTEHGKRAKRGLVDGVGYVANSLFGILDERFASQYYDDIEKIQEDEKHLLNLYKQHTSIIESEYNIIKRNEELMVDQFASISKQMAHLNNLITSEHAKSMYITATILTANLIINNLQRLQQQLLDLVTDVRSGRMDIHLLQPEEFINQLNIIKAQIPVDVTLPCLSSQENCIREMYKLSRVHVRLMDFLIFEVKLPLINTEPFELNRIIPIPKIYNESTIRITPTAEYSAINLKKDMIVPISENDVHRNCISFNENNLLCRLNLPIYKTTNELSTLCEANVINNRNITNCGTVSSGCSADWIMLHGRHAWLYTCCRECAVRIFCPDTNVITKTLTSTGILRMEPGCMLKGDNVVIHSERTYRTKLNINNLQELQIPESETNILLKSMNFTFTPVNHTYNYNSLQSQIEAVKKDQENMSIHNSSHYMHHYASYGCIGLVTTILGLVCLYRGIKKRLHGNRVADQRQDVEMQSASMRNSITEDGTPAAAQRPPRMVNRQTSP